MPQPRAFVLAGGRSSRMGRDKAQLPYGGSTLLEHMLAMLRLAGFNPGVAGLPPGIQCSAPSVPDAFPGDGPLAGIEAALHSVSGSQPALFVSVDLPLLPAVFCRVLWERVQATGASATVPFAGGKTQPLCAIYSSALAPGITAALTNGDRKVMRVINRLAAEFPEGQQCDYFRIESLAAARGWYDTHRWFTNVNTPADWHSVTMAVGSRPQPTGI